MKNKKKALVYLGSDNFNLNVLESLLTIIFREKKKLDFSFISSKSIKSKLLKNFKIYKNFNELKKKEKFYKFEILINLCLLFLKKIF